MSAVRVSAVLLLTLMFGIVLTAPASASSHAEDIAVAIKRSHVYASPNLESVTSDTVFDLSSRIPAEERLAIVMLASADLAAPTSDLDTIVENIDAATGSQYIIGLSVDGEMVGYAASATGMSAVTANDLMQRSQSITVTTVDTHKVFIRTVHDWMKQHPGAVSPLPVEARPVEEPPSDVPDSEESLMGVVSTLLIMAGVLLVSIFTFLRFYRNRDVPRFRGPRALRRRLRNTHIAGRQIDDQNVRGSLRQSLINTGMYFHRNVDRKDFEHSFEIFGRLLGTVDDIIEKYVDIQTYPEYYIEPQAKLAQGVRGVKDYGDIVLDAIRKGSEVNLEGYTLNADILAARRSVDVDNL